MDRRSFISSTLTSAGLAVLMPSLRMGETEDSSTEAVADGSLMLPKSANAGVLRGEMLYRSLGSTGVEVSAIGLGGSHIGKPAVSGAESIRLLDERELAAILANTAQAAAEGRYELFKTSSHFDTTARHSDWLGDDSPAVQQLAPQSAG
jgi:hypothetical protein